MSSPLSERNPVTQKAHRRQVFWQITIPLIVIALLAVAVAVLASLSSANTASRWADISLIFLIIPALLVAFLFLAFNAALIFGLVQLLKALPPFALKAQNLAYLVEARVRSMADSLAKPFIRANSVSAGWRRLWGR
jgi:hypothetical protein